MKTCRNCKISKDESHYYKHPKSKNGLNTICKDCQKLLYGDLNRKNSLNYYYRVKKEDPLKIRMNQWKKMGLSVTRDQYNKLYSFQGGKCAICDRHESILSNSLCLDHNHYNNQIRALLCTRCNVMIGNAEDNIQILEKAIDYLRSFI